MKSPLLAASILFLAGATALSGTPATGTATAPDPSAVLQQDGAATTGTTATRTTTTATRTTATQTLTGTTSTGAGGGTQAAGNGYSNGAARGGGLGPFVLRPNVTHPKFGTRTLGSVHPGLAEAAVQFFAGDLTPHGGLVRTNLNMWSPGREASAAKRLWEMKNAGLKSWLTAVGTPAWNASSNIAYGTNLPPFARSVPLDMQAWADDLVSVLELMRDEHGILPDYLEIWNEPDRLEWWAGTRQEILDLVGIAAATVGAAFPGSTMKIGGSGLASARSDMEGSNYVLEALIDQAAAKGHPLDFVSWHHYFPAGELRYQDVTNVFRAAADRHGFTDFELVISEYNISAGGNNPKKLEFDEGHAAAQLAGVVAGSAHMGVDHNLFFLMQDATSQEGIADLLGNMGLFTLRGIKKPVFRVGEFLRDMSREPIVDVDYPQDEWAVSLFATRSGNRVRVVLACDQLTAGWVWANACRERGGTPGYLWNVTNSLIQNGIPVTEPNLIAAGLEPWEAQIVLEVLPIGSEANSMVGKPRLVEIELQGQGQAVLQTAWRFDKTHNAPTTRREEFLPLLEWVESEANYEGYKAAVDILVANGITPPPYDPTQPPPSSPEQLAAMLGISLQLATEVFNAFLETRDEARLAHTGLLNSLPAAQVAMEPPSSALVTLSGKTISVVMEPDSVTIFDFTWN